MAIGRGGHGAVCAAVSVYVVGITASCRPPPPPLVLLVLVLVPLLAGAGAGALNSAAAIAGSADGQIGRRACIGKCVFEFDMELCDIVDCTPARAHSIPLLIVPGSNDMILTWQGFRPRLRGSWEPNSHYVHFL